MVLPEEDEASGGFNHYKPSAYNQANAAAAGRRNPNINGAIKVENDAIKVEYSPIKVENDANKRENRPIKLEYGPNKVENDAIELNRPIKLEYGGFKVENDSIELNRPIKLEYGGFKVENDAAIELNRPIKLEYGGFKVENDAIDFNRPIKLEYGAIKVETGAIELNCPIKYQYGAIKVENDAAIDLNRPIKLEYGAIKVENDAINVENNPINVEYGAVKKAFHFENGVLTMDNETIFDDDALADAACEAATAAALWRQEQCETAARRGLFPDPNAPIGCQGDLSYQNEVNLLLESAEERAKKYWNMDYEYYDYFHSMPGDPLNVKWQLEGVLAELEAAGQQRQLGPIPYPFI